MNAPKRFAYDLSTGGTSRPMRLGALMRAATRRLSPGFGPFTVIHGEFRHPGQKKADALKLMRAILMRAGKGAGLKVHDEKGHLVFSARRVATSVYDDPFRDAIYEPMRVDAGVDHNVHGKIYAIGPGIVVHVGTPSHTYTFGNDLMVIQFTEGPAAGRDYFLAEHYNTARGLKAGQHVDSTTVIATGNGPIEMGFSDGVGSLAWNATPYAEGQRSAIGESFNSLIVALGGKAALAFGRPVIGPLLGLPSSWKGRV